MQLLYMDSLEVDVMISDCTPRVNAWNSDLISTVLKKDRLGAGVFGKLQVLFTYLLESFFVGFAPLCFTS